MIDRSNPVSLRPAASHDIPEIMRIQAAAREASQWSPETYVVYDCVVATSGGVVVGFIVTRGIGEAAYEILNLAVDARVRRAGIATMLVRDVLSRLRGEIFLEVRESNSGARKLYRRLGFQEAGLRHNYYSDPGESAIVMKLQS